MWSINENKGYIKLNKLVLILGLILVGSIILSNVVSAATVQNNHITTAKINKVGSASYNQTNPAIDGNRAVWVQSSSSKSIIYTKNLLTGHIARVHKSTQNQYNPDISHNRVVWEQNVGNKSVIFTKNLISGNTAIVCKSRQNQSLPKISGSRIIWIQNQEVYIKNILTGNTGVVSKYEGCLPYSDYPSNWTIDISGNRVIWQVMSFDHTEKYADISYSYYNYGIYTKNLKTGKIAKIYSVKINDESMFNYFDLYPSISGNRVVWENREVWEGSNYVLNLGTGKKEYINQKNDFMGSPDISGTRIVWTDWKGVVWIKNLKTGRTVKVQTSKYYQDQPKISGNRVIWIQYNKYKYNPSNPGDVPTPTTSIHMKKVTI